MSYLCWETQKNSPKSGGDSGDNTWALGFLQNLCIFNCILEKTKSVLDKFKFESPLTKLLFTFFPDFLWRTLRRFEPDTNGETPGEWGVSTNKQEHYGDKSLFRWNLRRHFCCNLLTAPFAFSSFVKTETSWWRTPLSQLCNWKNCSKLYFLKNAGFQKTIFLLFFTNTRK